MRLFQAVLHAILALRVSKNAHCAHALGIVDLNNWSILVNASFHMLTQNNWRRKRKTFGHHISYAMCYAYVVLKGRLAMLGVPTPRRRWLFACHFAVPPRPSYVRMDYTLMRSAMTVQLMKDFGNSSELGPNSQINLKVQAIVRAQAVGLRVP